MPNTRSQNSGSWHTTSIIGPLLGSSYKLFSFLLCGCAYWFMLVQATALVVLTALLTGAPTIFFTWSWHLCKRDGRGYAVFSAGKPLKIWIELNWTELFFPSQMKKRIIMMYSEMSRPHWSLFPFVMGQSPHLLLYFARALCCHIMSL